MRDSWFVIRFTPTSHPHESTLRLPGLKVGVAQGWPWAALFSTAFKDVLWRRRTGQKDGTIKCNGVEKRIGLAEPDMEEKMKGILMVTSNSPVLCYETLRSFEKRSQRSFSIPSLSCRFQTQTPFSIDSTCSKTFVGSQSSSIQSSLSNSFVSLHTARRHKTEHIGTD